MTGYGLRSAGLAALATAAAALAGPAAASFDDGLTAFERGNYAAAYEAWRPLAESGNAEAQFYLGVLYDHGYHVPRNYQEAASWYERAADQGHSEAAFALGFLYYNGAEGDVADGSVARDLEEAALWLRQATADNGYPQAKRILGELYMQGDGVSQNYREACFWLTEAAEAGLPAAQFNAGLLHARGQGCDQDPVLAYALFSLADEQNYPGAAQNADRLAGVLSEDEIDRAREQIERLSGAS